MRKVESKVRLHPGSVEHSRKALEGSLKFWTGRRKKIHFSSSRCRLLICVYFYVTSWSTLIYFWRFTHGTTQNFEEKKIQEKFGEATKFFPTSFLEISRFFFRVFSLWIIWVTVANYGPVKKKKFSKGWDRDVRLKTFKSFQVKLLMKFETVRGYWNEKICRFLISKIKFQVFCKVISIIQRLRLIDNS